MYLDAIPSTTSGVILPADSKSSVTLNALTFNVLSNLEKNMAVVLNSNLEAVLKKYEDRPKNTPIFHAAVKAHDKESVRILLNNRFTIDQRAPDSKMDDLDGGGIYWTAGDTPLELAFKNNDLEMMQFLLEQGANPTTMRLSHYGNPKHRIHEYSLIYEAIWKVIVSSEMRDASGRAYGIDALKLIIASGANLNQLCIYTEEGLPPLRMTPLQFIQFRIQNFSGGWASQEEMQAYYEMEKMFLETENQ
jgi:hypothetical protein